MAIIGTIGNNPKIRGTVKVSALPYYEGDYTVTPRLNEAITLQTAQKAMSQNVTVTQIPMYQTENDKGGLTVIIG